MGYPAELPPLKAPNQIMGMDFVPKRSMFPGLMSVKHNGMRADATTLSDGTPVWKSYNGERIRMAPHIKEMFQDILEYAAEHQTVMDGEFNSSECNTVGQTMSILAGTKPCPDDFMFKCFYELPYSVWNTATKVPMGDLIATPRHYLENFFAVPQQPVDSWEDFEAVCEENRNNNLEGFMLLNPRSYWRHGRSTVKECILLKYKYYSDPIDARIVDIMPRKEKKKGLPILRNGAGYAKRGGGMAAYQETDIGGVICCIKENGEPVSVPFPVGTTTPQKAMYLKEFRTGSEYDLNGKWLQFKELSVENGPGSIAIKEVEFRDSK